MFPRDHRQSAVLQLSNALLEQIWRAQVEQQDQSMPFHVGGNVELLKCGVTGNMSLIAALRAGEGFGEMTLCANAPFNATVRSLAEPWLLEWSGAQPFTAPDRSRPSHHRGHRPTGDPRAQCVGQTNQQLRRLGRGPAAAEARAISRQIQQRATEQPLNQGVFWDGMSQRLNRALQKHGKLIF